MKTNNSHSVNPGANREKMSWVLIALGAASILTAKVIFLARFADFAENPLAGIGLMMSWGELCFLLFPYLGLAYFRLYAANTIWNRRLVGAMAALFLISGLVLSAALIGRDRADGFDFYFHSLVCLVLQSGTALLAVALGRGGGKWRPTEFLALFPLLASAVMLMSNVSMMWTRQLTGAALLAPYAFLALDLVRRLILSLFASRETVREDLEESPAVILKNWPAPVEFAGPSVVELLPGQAIFAQSISQKLPRQAQIGGGLF